MNTTSSAVVPPKTVDVKAELATIDKMLGPDENITYVNSTARSPGQKALSAGRFNRFLSSQQKADVLFGNNSESLPMSPTIAIDPLREVRQERKIYVGPPAIFNQDHMGGASAPSAPSAPITKPPTLLNPAHQYAANPLPYTSALVPPSSSTRMQLNMNTDELPSPHRPLEGTAMSYLKSQQASGPTSPYYNPPAVEKALQQKIPSAVTTPSSAASILEREEFLQKMRNMRQKIQTKH